MSNPMIRAVGIPEIVLLISRYLDATDVLVCSTVSKHFHDSFVHLVWQDIHLGKIGPAVLKTIFDTKPQARFISFDTRASKEDKAVRENTYGKTRQSLSYDDQMALLKVLQKNACWIRSLSIHSHEFYHQLALGQNCSQLESISIDHPQLSGKFDTKYWNNLKKLIKQNREALVSLSFSRWDLDMWKKPTTGQRLWSPILNCSEHMNLRKLVITVSRIRGRHLKAFWEICQRLEYLVLRDVWFDLSIRASEVSRVNAVDRSKDGDQSTTGNGTITAAIPRVVRFPRLQHFSLCQIIRASAMRQLDLLISHCPVLQSLVWSLPWKMSFPDTKFYEYFDASTWPRLQSIVVKDHNGWVKDELHSSLLKSSKPGIKVLDLRVLSIRPQTFDSMRRHFHTLTTINMYDAREPEASEIDGAPAWIQEVLEHCPALVRITAKTVTAQHIINGNPWVCLGLEEFNVMINMEFPRDDGLPGEGPRQGRQRKDRFSEDEKEQCFAVFECLSRLRRLKILNMKLDYWSLSGTTSLFSLPLQLDLGLSVLASLSRIEKLGYHGFQDMRLVDIDWILKHWPNLREVDGDRLSTKKAKSKQDSHVRDYILMKMLDSRGIRTTRRYYQDQWDTHALKENIDHLTLDDSSSENEEDQE
ncbi:hypothetical protein BGX21_004168 [Mortierella sp. AD011]|nr:hypothetical protein BGX21_004168 [Mortierella sp. AD011]